MKLSEDFSYEELLQRLSIDLPSVLPGVVQSSIGGSSGSVSQPAQGTTLVWDASQQLYVPSSEPPSSGNWQWSTPNSVTNVSGGGIITYLAETLTLTTASPRVLWLVGGSAYLSSGGGGNVVVSGQVDSSGWFTMGNYYFSYLNTHETFGPFFWTSNPPQGTHTFSVGLSVTGSSGNVTTDSNDHINVALIEMPGY